MNNPFKGRSITAAKDFSIDELGYIFKKTRELKEAFRKGGDKKLLDSYRIDDLDLGLYEVFLEDSTRTKESFKNAAEFHRIKHNILDVDHSSINKSESYADTFNTLIGYNNSIFVVRSKLEGVCRWLAHSGYEYAKRHGLNAPAFINAGDGKHEHPTQEILDEFSFLEDNKWDNSEIHLALIGDLFHGRTVHSKVEGLKIFNRVKVDLVAPEELEMPPHYIDMMKKNGFRVRKYKSIDSYIEEGDMADKWYFTRPQLERMGERILKKQDELRAAITIEEEHLDQIPKETGFYHPLPRHKKFPTIPRFIDNTPYNRYEKQSQNGKFTRIVLLSAIAGVIGNNFRGAASSGDLVVKDYMKKVNPKHKKRAKLQEGILPIKNGIVIDHICRGEEVHDVWTYMPIIRENLGIDDVAYMGVSKSRSSPGIYKGIISLPRHNGLDDDDILKLASIAPGCTLNAIKNNKIFEKIRLSIPKEIEGLKGTACKNNSCISHEEHYEGIQPEFYRMGNKAFVCKYCDTAHTFKEIWKKE